MSIVLDPQNSIKSIKNSSTSNIGGQTAINGSINDVATTIVVDSTSEFPSSGTIKIDSEYIKYTGVSGGVNLTGCVRGSFNSTAVSHSDNAIVQGIYIGLSELNAVPDVMVSLKSSSAGTEYFDFSVNNIEWDTFPVPGFTVGANVHEFHTAVKGKRYFRLRFEPSSATQTTSFRANTFYGVFRQSYLPLNQSITDSSDSQIVRSVISAKNEFNVYSNVEITNQNELKVNSGDRDMFGINLSASMTPIIQNYQLYGIVSNPQLYVPSTSDGGTITASSDGTSVILSTSTTVNSYATFRSSRALKYRPGYSLVCRIVARFDTNAVANSLQFCGVGNPQSDLYFCYNGTDFGVRLSTGGQLEVRKLTITSASTGSETATITLNSVSYTVSLTNAGGAISFTAHKVEVGSFGNLWTTEHAGNDVFFIAKSVGSRGGSYSMSSASAVGTFSLIKAGVALTTTNVSKSSWNGTSDMISALDVSKNNMYEITYSWYGAGNIDFRIYNPNVSRYETVHTMTFANTDTIPSITSPNMYIQKGVMSLGSTSALSVVSIGSFGAVLGTIDLNKGPSSALNFEKSISSNTPTVILVIKNRSQINGYSNHSEIYVQDLSVSSDGTKSVSIKLYKNPATLSANTTTNYTNYEYVNQANSLVLYDTTTDTFSGGDNIFSFTVAKVSSQVYNLGNRGFYLGKDETLIIVAESSATTDITTAITFSEDY
jgi:hypothetical protein